MDRARLLRIGRLVALAGLVVLVAIQFVPYGWKHSNPPVVEDAPWPDEASRELARAACYDCHSNETDWPFYSYVAPASWLTRRDVESGRDHLNFSRWDEDAGEADDAIETLRDGSMPPDNYTLLHRDAALSDEEVDRLVAALEVLDEADGGGDDGGDDDDGGNGDDNSGRGS